MFNPLLCFTLEQDSPPVNARGIPHAPYNCSDPVLVGWEGGGGEREAGYPCPGQGYSCPGLWYHPSPPLPPVDRHTPVNTLTSRRTTYADGKYANKLVSATINVDIVSLTDSPRHGAAGEEESEAQALPAPHSVHFPPSLQDNPVRHASNLSIESEGSSHGCAHIVQYSTEIRSLWA